MNEQMSKLLAPLKEFWAKQAPNRKKIILGAAAGIVLLAVVIVAFLNGNSGGLVTLYTGLDRAEAASVYTALQEMEIPAQMDQTGNVLVPREQVDTVRLELASKGYPKTGLSYDIFSNANGLTTTESDRKIILAQQLQENMVQTLTSISGVQKAVVMLNVASGSNYVWEQETQKSTASVLLTLDPEFEMSKKQVSAIKTLVATGVPKLAPADVTVVDAATSMELGAEEADAGGMLGELERLGFERQIEKGLEDKAKRVLSLFYGNDQMAVAATVVLNYDKMISESMQYKPTEGNTGVVDQIDEQYAMSPSSIAQGVPGEEDNTDIPVYVDQNADGVPEYVDHTRSIDYAIPYIKQQVEKGKAELTSASMAVMVKDTDLNQQKHDSMLEQISKATNIPVGSISVETLDVAQPIPDDTVDTTPGLLDDPVLLAVIGLGALSLLIVIFMVMRMLRKGKKKKKLTNDEVDDAELEQQRLQREMDDKKRILREAADAQNSEENMIATEVRTFAKDNPEIAAGLIRSWLKEDE